MSPKKTPERLAEEERVRAAIADLQASVSSTSGGANLSRYSPTSGTHTLSARIENSAYYALAATSQAEGVSVNSLLNDAITHYVTSPEFKERRAQTRPQTEAQKRADDAIRKLSGG